MPGQPRDGDEAREPRRVARAVRDQASAKRVYGDPIELDGSEDHSGRRRSPLRQPGRLRAERERKCGCSCNSARPVGLVVIRDGQVSWTPTLDLNRVVMAVAGVLGLLIFLRHR